MKTQMSRPAKPLSDGWQALKRMHWAEARACFETAAAEEPSAEALERLSLAAWWLDDARTMFEARERAYVLYRRQRDKYSAARLATLLGIDHYQFRGEPAIGNGWFRRAHRLLDGLPPAAEHGWLSIWEGQIALLICGGDFRAQFRLLDRWASPAVAAPQSLRPQQAAILPGSALR
jgi:hypothetical protein